MALTLEQFQAKRRKQVQEQILSGKALQKSALFTHTNTIVRIFISGLNSANRSIGRYSVRPTLAGRKSFVTKKGFNKFAGTKAKRRKLQWRTVGGKKLFIVRGGYKAIREADGRFTTFVVLVRTDAMRKDFARAPHRVANNKYVADIHRKENIVKAVSNEKRFGGKIFNLTKSEQDFFNNKHNEFVIKAFTV